MAMQDLINKILGKKTGKAGLVGLSFGEQEVALAHVAYDKREPVLRHCEVFAASSDKERLEGLQKRVEKLGLEDTRCSYVLSPADYNLVLVEAPNVEANEMLAAVKWKIKELIDRPLEEVAISIFPIPKGAYKSQTEMVYVVAARKDKIIDVAELISKSGLYLDVIDIPELVMHNLSTSYADDSNGLAFMDLRSSGSTINLSRNGEIYLTRRLNTQVDQEIMNSAEWESIRERLVLEIQRSLDYYESQMGQTQVSRLLLAPRQQDAETLVQQLNNAMAVKVECMNLNGKLSTDIELSFPLQQASMLAIGGALRQEQVS